MPVVLAVIISLTALAQIERLASAQRREASRRALITAKWYTFTGPDGDFRIDFPRKPAREEDAQGLVTTIRTYGVTIENGMRFSINFQDIGGDPRSRENNEWASNHEAEVTAAARENGERVVQIHRQFRAALLITELILRISTSTKELPSSGEDGRGPAPQPPSCIRYTGL